VPLRQSQRLHEALTQAGVPSTLHVVQGAGHGFGGPDIQNMLLRFFDNHLQGLAATPAAAPGGTRSERVGKRLCFRGTGTLPVSIRGVSPMAKALGPAALPNTGP
jgi:acetyl esterase/lipase